VFVSIKLGVNGLFWFYIAHSVQFFRRASAAPALANLGPLLRLSASMDICIQARYLESHYQMDPPFAVLNLPDSQACFASVFAYRGRRQREQLIELAAFGPFDPVLAIEEPWTGA